MAACVHTVLPDNGCSLSPKIVIALEYSWSAEPLSSMQESQNDSKACSITLSRVSWSVDDAQSRTWRKSINSGERSRAVRENRRACKNVYLSTADFPDPACPESTRNLYESYCSAHDSRSDSTYPSVSPFAVGRSPGKDETASLTRDRSGSFDRRVQ